MWRGTAGKKTTRQTGRAKVRGRSGPSILSSTVALQGPVSRHLSQGWGGQARRQAPLTACYRHMLLEHVHAQTGMTENGMGLYGLVCTKLSWPYLVWSDLQDRKCHWREEHSAWPMLVLKLACTTMCFYCYSFWLGHDWTILKLKYHYTKYKCTGHDWVTLIGL